MKLGLEADRATHSELRRPHVPGLDGVRRPVPVRRPLAGGAEPSGPEAGFRTDIEGLRAIAVISVVAYHLELRGFSGGFVGVDVFFVISGFLITRRLLRGAVEDRTVHIRDFYAARARRILPMATVVIVATIGAAMIWQDRLQLLQSTGADARSATLFFSNLRFASQGTDYMAEADAPSLFLQFWSLSVEEQFYLLWPALLLALVAVAARRAGSIRTSVTVTLGLIVGLSFWLSQRYSTTDPVKAFFPAPEPRLGDRDRGPAGGGWPPRSAPPPTPLAPWPPSEVWPQSSSRWSVTTCPRSGRAGRRRAYPCSAPRW